MQSHGRACQSSGPSHHPEFRLIHLELALEEFRVPGYQGAGFWSTLLEYFFVGPVPSRNQYEITVYTVSSLVTSKSRVRVWGLLVSCCRARAPNLLGSMRQTP